VKELSFYIVNAVNHVNKKKNHILKYLRH